jgi:hypothetical protein
MREQVWNSLQIKYFGFSPLTGSFDKFIYFLLIVGLTAIGVITKQVTSSNQEIALPFSELGNS